MSDRQPNSGDRTAKKAGAGAAAGGAAKAQSQPATSKSNAKAKASAGKASAGKASAGKASAGEVKAADTQATAVTKDAAQPISADQRRAMIAERAYLRAERRGFINGDTVTDWLEGEREIDRMLTRGD